MKVVDISEAGAHLSRLIQDALDGGDVVIARGNELLVRLTVIESERPRRSLGWAKGKVMMMPDFDAPLGGFVDDRDTGTS